MDVSNDEIENCVFEKTEEIPLHVKIAKVMQITSVVKTVFKFLNLKDIKNCRQVCLNWDKLAEPLLRKRSKIVFDFLSGRTHTKFAETFSAAHSTLNFVAFTFSGWDWPKSVVEDFFNQQQQVRNVEELEFNSVILKDENNREVPNHYIDDWLVGLPIIKLSILNCDENWSLYRSNLMVSLDVLGSVEELHLNWCRIHLSPKFKIAPKKIKLINVSFCRNKYVPTAPVETTFNDVVNEIQINTVLDFKNASTIHIECPSNNTSQRASHIIISLERCVEIDNLKLTGTKITNWGGCVGDLELDEIPLVEPNVMKVKSLTFSESTIDLSVIGPEIENISLGHYMENAKTNILCSQPINFPNLKRVVFYGATTKALPYFNNCPNLVNVLFIDLHKDVILHLDWIPKSVKRLEIHGPIKHFVGNKVDIDYLVFKSVSLGDVETILKYFNPKMMVGGAYC